MHSEPVLTSDPAPASDPTPTGASGPAPTGERGNRKDDHVRIATEQRATQRAAQRSGERGARNEFDDLEFLFHALDGVSRDRVSLGVTVDAWQWQAPLYVNGMTGGTEQTERINRELAIAARETGIPMSCGSAAIALDAPDDRAIVESFTVIRKENPSGFVMANIGVDRSASDAVRAVELLGADALQVHLNAVQETAMPEGSRDFSEWPASLERIVQASPVPVIVKEVGFGLSRRTLARLESLGVRIADVSGRGGTDFLRIENARGGDFGMLAGLGQSALASLLDAPARGPVLLASGGVRNPFDVVKALASGARAVGVAGTFLECVQEGGAEQLITLINAWLEQLRAILALLGAESPSGLRDTDLMLRGRLREFCELRGIDTTALSQRSSA